MLQCDISTGMGSAVQVVRFPEAYDDYELETLYYTNAIPPTFEEQLAPALLLGYEYQGNPSSRFCSNYYDCLKHGAANKEQARHAIVWAKMS